MLWWISSTVSSSYFHTHWNETFLLASGHILHECYPVISLMIFLSVFLSTYSIYVHIGDDDTWWIRCCTNSYVRRVNESTICFIFSCVMDICCIFVCSCMSLKGKSKREDKVYSSIHVHLSNTQYIYADKNGNDYIHTTNEITLSSDASRIMRFALRE